MKETYRSPGKSDYSTGKEDASELTGTKNYEVSEKDVEVRYRKFFYPESSDKNGINLFMPGFSVKEDAKSIEEFCNSFTKLSGVPTYAIDTLPTDVDGDIIEFEAQAVKKFVQSLNPNQVILLGHSRGGTKAMHLAYQLQESSDIEVAGLVLLNSVGLYPLTIVEILKHAGMDLLQTNLGLLRSTDDTIREKFLPKAHRLIPNAIFTQTQKIAKAKLAYPSNLLKELKSVQEVNPYAGKIKAPIVILTGIKDKFCDPEKIIPAEETGIKFLRDPEAREKYLKQTLFRSSPYVKMLVAKKMPFHNDFIFRPESFARASFRLIRPK